MKKLAFTLIFLSQLCHAAWAQSFVIKKIEFQGLQRISPSTVAIYLPVKRGQTLAPSRTAAILRDLYRTGFFEHISLSQENGTLIIHVVERPTIGQLKISGNSVIPTDKLTTVMKSLDIAEGRVYNPAILEKIKKGLLSQYYQLGRYNARVDIDTSPMPRNRVLVKINISEGLVSKIHRITIIGNHAFDESTLVKQLDITTSGLFTFFTQTDRYSEEKLEASLEKLRTFYMNHGYVRFEIKSAQAEVSPDRKSVYIIIIVQEGEPYTISGYELQGKFVVPREELMKQVHIKPGTVFSRQQVIDAETGMNKLLGSQGYVFSAITIRPEVNDKTKQVSLIFNINPGKRNYVRHVTFSDNNRTNDVVLRRQVTQWESAPVSTSKLDDSKRNLSLLPYIRDVEMTVKPVPETDDQVDINYKVKEENSATATFKIGYSQLYRTTLGAGLNQKNFFGTGNTFGINLSRSRYEQAYSVNYTNPYYTEDGISRSFNLAMYRVDPRGAGVNNGYTNNEYDAGVLYGIPISQEEGAINQLQAGIGYQNTIVYLIPGQVANQINSYVTKHGTHFQVADLKLGYTRDSRDRAIFPTQGGVQNIFVDAFVPVSHRSVSYYTLNYNAKWYQPLTDQFIILSRADLGYGSGFHGAGDFPFFRNYYAGGIDSVRGFQGYTLGPRDSFFRPYGGNILTDASLGLIFPNFLSDNLRTSVFFDGGNVYSTLNNRNFGGQSTGSGPIRFSAGVEADWLTPLGPIELSLAQPINARPHDSHEVFQFSLGANF